MKGKDNNSPQQLYAEGVAAVAEYLRQAPQCVLKIQATRDAKLPRYFLHNVQSQGFQIEVVKAQPHGLTAPVWAEVRHKTWGEADLIDALQNHPQKLVLALDHITDPRNLGAVVRSAAFFGVTWVIVPTRRQALINQAVLATSQGGLAVVKVAAVVNLRRTLERLKELQYWLLAADMGGEDCATLKGFYERQVLVLGSEGKGLSDQVRKQADRLVAIPGGALGFDSLNVSVAGGVLMYLFS